jgi:hypothetical protein
VILGPLFDRPLHPIDWIRPRGSLDYRVTNPFDGEDLVNGGQHEAVDVGNASTGHPVLAPADCRARGLRNYSRSGTDALGIEFDLGDGWRLELWHLSATFAVIDQNAPAGTTSWGAWHDVKRGQIVAKTGNTGALVRINGVLGPMPAHTHIRLERDGKPVDPEPYLFGRALPIGEEDTVKYAGWVEHVVNRKTTVRANDTNLRALPTTASPSLGQYEAGRSVVPHEIYRGTAPKGSADRTWYLVTMPAGDERVVGFFHASVLTELEPIEPVADSKLTGLVGSHLAEIDGAIDDIQAAAARADRAKAAAQQVLTG